VAHSYDEYVMIDDLLTAYEVLRRAVQRVFTQERRGWSNIISL